MAVASLCSIFSWPSIQNARNTPRILEFPPPWSGQAVLKVFATYALWTNSLFTEAAWLEVLSYKLESQPFYIRCKNILTRQSYFTIFQVESFFLSALAMMWHLIMDSPETFPWGLLHQKYLFWEDSRGVFHHDSSSLWPSLLLNPELI